MQLILTISLWSKGQRRKAKDRVQKERPVYFPVKTVR